MRPRSPVPDAADDAPIVADAYRQVKDRLNGLVTRLAQQGEYRLPAEDRLSATLGVSRPTIRSALLSLQKEGKIQRFHGRGTFINKYALTMRVNLAEDRPFRALISQLGYAATVRTLSVAAAVPDDAVTELLELAAPASTCVVDRMFEADGRPAVLSRDYVPVGLLVRSVDQVDARDSTFAFVSTNTRRQVLYSIAELVPTLADARTAELLGVAVGTPLLMIRHLHLDEEQTPVAVTDSLVNDAILRFSVVRTYSGS